MIATLSNLPHSGLGGVCHNRTAHIGQKEIQTSRKIKCAYKTKSQKGWAKDWFFLKLATGTEMFTSLWFIQLKYEPIESETNWK